LTRKSELKKLSDDKIACDKENSNTVFCFCNGPETPQMIGLGKGYNTPTD